MADMARTKGDEADKKMRTVSTRMTESLYQRLVAIAEADAANTISRKKATISEVLAVAAEDFASRYESQQKGRKK